ncbi:MAG: serine hydrolase [Melioribacteraceae bacterium]|jgi:CubicO group peptidase (beta-lactamase class C family)|nr:serine hydrolase [Melioribacteraceae bacterium]
MLRKISFIILATISLIACNEKSTFDNQVDEIFAEFNNSTPGASVLILQNDSVLFQKGYGLGSLEKGITIEPKTNFRLASITKQFTAFSILLLENENKLSFDDKLVKYFPELPASARDITIRQILQHTSGLLAYEDYLNDTLTIQLKDKDVLDILVKQDSTYFPPGTKHRYSNSGYAILALLVEKLSTKTYAQFINDRIFNPLKMGNSVAFENGVSKIKNRAYGYAKVDSGFIFTDQSLTSAILGDGGIYSSTLDLVKWNNEIDIPTLLPQKKLKLAFEKLVLPSGEVVNYGFGWRLDPYKEYQRPYHTGGTSGFSNIYMKIPKLNLAIIVLIIIRECTAKAYAEKIADILISNQN